MKNNIKISLLFCLFFFITGGINHAQSTKTLKKREARLKRQIKQTESLINQTKKTQQATLSELAIINKQINYREELSNNLNNQIKQIETDIENNSEEIIALTNQLKKLKIEFKEMVRFAYKNRNKDFNMLYLLASSDINEAYKRMKYINQYAENRKLQAKEVKHTQERLAQENEQLIKNKEEKLLVIDEAKSTKESFEKDKAYQQKVLAKINTNQSSLQQKLNKQKQERDKISKAIKDAIKKELAKTKPKTNPKTNKTETFKQSPEAKLLGKKFIENKGRLPWPVNKGTVTRRFGKQQHSVVSTAYIENNGVDISTSKSASVRVVFDGTVTSVLSIPGSGKAVIVSHGDYRTVYANLKEVSVKTGQSLKTKDKIGVLITNSAGISESHFEIWRISGGDMRPVNPSPWLIKR